MDQAEQTQPRLRPAQILGALRDYLGLRNRGRQRRIADRRELERFVDSRASHVAQTALYGYLRTRAGTRYPELFENDRFLASINIAKWQVWLACLSDLCVYAGGLIASRSAADQEQVGGLMSAVTEAVLAAAGTPAEAGERFHHGAARVRRRVAWARWQAVADDETPFCESPGALVEWAPIVEDLKRLDDEIVRNSVRFRWHEIRRELRRELDADAIIAVSRAAREGSKR